MKAADIPPELLEILDQRAGRIHNRQGIVVRTLAEILTRYDEIREQATSFGVRSVEKSHPPTEDSP